MGGKLYMDAVLRPHRSLSLAAFRVVLIVMVVANLIVAVVFIAHGAYPVAGFLGLDVAALWLAFVLNYRAARLVERVRIASDTLHVARMDVNGAETHWRVNPFWARVAREGNGVLIWAGKSALRLGAYLSPKECESFAAALNAALHGAKRGV